jgi:hypothetical protein
MINIQIGKKQFQAASCYDELTREQALFVLGVAADNKILLEKIPKVIEHLLPVEEMLKAGYNQVARRWAKDLRKAHIWQNPPQPRQILYNDFAKYFTWILEPKFTKNVLEYVKIDGERYILPTEQLGNVGIYQWHWAAQQYHYYTKTRKETYLHQFLACVFQQEGKTFDPQKKEEHGNRISKLPSIIVYAIAQFVTEQWANIANGYPELFTGKDGGEPNYTEILFKAAEASIFGDLDKVGNTPVSTILMWLARNVEQQKQKES